MTTPHFEAVPRQQFRQVFQPSRVVIALFKAPTKSGVNAITLCFDMHCSYKPPMMAFAVYHRAYTHSLLESASECVLAIPGETMAKEAMYCGLESGRDVDKVTACGLELAASATIGVPGLAKAIANIELRIACRVPSGDHLLVVGEVVRYGVNPGNRERCLLSVGPNHDGYEVLARSGIHRLGVVARSNNQGATNAP
jgi:flavin reductase (DIM6/NTAB) family NADH-FMN oxidoreductase RutF